jgi:hypothetical protein
MARIKKNNSFPEKYLKILDANVMAEMEALDEHALKKSIVDSENAIDEQEKNKEADDNLQSAKEKVKELSKDYSDTIKFQKAKIKYSLFLLESKGKL